MIRVLEIRLRVSKGFTQWLQPAPGPARVGKALCWSKRNQIAVF